MVPTSRLWTVIVGTFPLCSLQYGSHWPRVAGKCGWGTEFPISVNFNGFKWKWPHASSDSHIGWCSCRAFGGMSKWGPDHIHLKKPFVGHEWPISCPRKLILIGFGIMHTLGFWPACVWRSGSCCLFNTPREYHRLRRWNRFFILFWNQKYNSDERKDILVKP